jgi:hypothetical protein
MYVYLLGSRNPNGTGNSSSDFLIFNHTPFEAFKAYAGQKKPSILSSWPRPPNEANPISCIPINASPKKIEINKGKVNKRNNWKQNKRKTNSY